MTEKNNIVAALTDHETDKYTLLERVLDLSEFFQTIDQAWKNSGKAKENFSVAIKPNISMMLRRNDVGTYTDPFLVVHLCRLLLKRDYTNLCVVESQNLYGNWFKNRSVVQVAARAGYFGDVDPLSLEDEGWYDIPVQGDGIDARVPLIDLTLDTVEGDLGEGIGTILLPKTWIEADFRINFAKMKTHFYSYYTLAIKNIYGCLPLQDKVKSYHCKRAVGPWTARLIEKFPVHFSIIDGFQAADGWLGVKMKAIARKTHTFIAGKDIQAADHFGATLMGLDPEKSIMYTHLAKRIPPKPYSEAGNAKPFNPWSNTLGLLVWLCVLIESNADFMDWCGSLATGGYDPCFPHKSSNVGLLKKILFLITLPVNICIDIGFFRLKARILRFTGRLKSRKEKAPTLINTPYLLSRLPLLSTRDLMAFQSLLENWPQSGGALTKPNFSGHYFILDENPIPFPARLTPANLALAEICHFIREKGLDPISVSRELGALATFHGDLFAPDTQYARCFQ
ncbi:MAG: DUF362 domain-containing protein [Desulfatibacillum sp.]|nr:DUF362 domain-containing protein [Desulfatibacillum sp.]